METVVLKHKRTTLERAEKFISSDYFTDVNLSSRLHPEKSQLTRISHYEASDRISYDKAVKGKYSDTSVGTAFGPTWSTHWFCVELDIPNHWSGQEVHLLWNSGSEALVWQDGCPLQGLSSGNKRISFPMNNARSEGKNRYKLYIEMACNTLFGAGNGLINPPVPDKTFMLSQAEIAIFDRDVHQLILDIETLHDMAKHLPEESERGYTALYTVNDMINTIIVDDRASYTRAHDIAMKYFQQGNGPGHHTIHAMGHAHIDSAWLWPYAETIRKCARSWSCTVALMEKYPNFKFTCSQAQQYSWVKEHYPKLYQKIKQFVKTGQFIPVGATWVEMDGNMPSGESFIRQFLYGQKYFKEEFGLHCKEFWLPDTFGYSAQLPQILQTCGVKRFLTQKLSWSLVNKFPHHTFFWEGIDGSKVLTHFPPGDSYEMKGKVDEVIRTINNYKDKGRSSKSVFLFGFGDGGHGPSEEMLDRLDRLKDVNGLPRVEMSTPDRYFSDVEENDLSKLCRWRGELYLELHNGTYTTHALLKKCNRKCEFMMHNLEFVATVTALTCPGYQYPSEEMEEMWKSILLNQFHDILPGSSIRLVFEDAVKMYQDVETKYEKLLNKALVINNKKSKEACYTIHNTLGWDRTEVIALDAEGKSPSKKKRTSGDENLTQIDYTGRTLALMEVQSYGSALYKPLSFSHPSHALKKGDMYSLKNKHVSATFDKEGRMVKLHLSGAGGRNVISSDYPGNQFVMFDDIPLFWDAWDVMDYHLETRKPVREIIQHVKILDEGPLRASLEFSLKISNKSYINQVISLDAESPLIRFETEVHWHENRKFLKIEFPTSIHSMEATYEIQCGHLKRTNHNNTSWDSAQFEVCGQKWADLSEHGCGVAVMNDCKYGYSCLDNILRLSLLRSPKAPDEKADMGVHKFTYAVMPHKGNFQEAGVIQQSYNMNCPLVTSETFGEASEAKSYFRLDNPQIVLETVKMCEDSTKKSTAVLRFYESFGGQGKTILTSSLKIMSAHRCNSLEDEIEDTDKSVQLIQGDIHLNFKPFQIISVLVQFN